MGKNWSMSLDQVERVIEMLAKYPELLTDLEWAYLRKSLNTTLIPEAIRSIQEAPDCPKRREAIKALLELDPQLLGQPGGVN